MELNDFLTNEQIIAIREIIRQRCTTYRELIAQLDRMCYAPYMLGRRHDFTGVILSGFLPNTDVVPGMTITDVKYGRGLSQPELVGENIVLNIYNGSNPLNSQYIQEQCTTYNANLNARPLFGCILFETDKNYRLTKLTLQMLDQYANNIDEFVLYEAPRLAVLQQPA